MPIQSVSAASSPGKVILDPSYQDGLIDLNGFSHIFLIYRFHHSHRYRLRVTPFLDDREHGVFATRAPRRPNPIGISIVRLQSIRQNIIEFNGADMLDNTPLLDIKPYIPQFDRIATATSGWLTLSESELDGKKSDTRFIVN